MADKKIPFYKRILFRLLIPVMIVGITCSTLLVYYLSSPMEEFLIQQFDANLRLASFMGMEACEESFNYLMDLRLEKNAEMNLAMKNEMIERIKAVGGQFPHVHLAVVESGRIIGSCHPFSVLKNWDRSQIRGRGDNVIELSINDKKARSLAQYFPFWDWHVISFVFEKDYQAPIRMAYTITYLSALIVFIAVVGTLILLFHLFIARPMNRLVTATDAVSEGKLFKIERKADNEFGRLMTSFNGMIDSLENEQKEVQRLIQELKESEALFRSQFEFGNIGIAITMASGELIRANERLCHMLGYTEEGLQGKAWSKIYHQNDLDNSMVNYRRMLKGEIESFEMDMRLFHNNGNIIFTHLSVSCFRNSDRSVRTVIISILDITKRKEAEKALQKSEAYLWSLFRAAPTGIGVVVDRVFDQVNEKLCAITGYSKEEMIGKNARMLYPDDDEFEYVGREKYDLIRKNGTGTVETRWQRKDGQIVDVLLSSTPMDLNDFSKGVTFTALDITDRKHSETAQLEANRMLRLVLDTIPVRVFWKDRKSRYQGCNQAFADDAGKSAPEEVVGNDDYAFPWAETQAESFIQDDHAVMTTGKSRILYEERQTRKDGVDSWLQTSKVPMRNSEANIIGVLGTYQDITERKAIEAHLQRAQKMEAIGTLAGGIAHDFNNILSAIIGYTELSLSKVEKDAPIYGYLDKVIKAGERARDLVQQILTFGRQHESEFSSVKVKLIVKEVAKFIRATLPTTIEIKQHINDDPTVMADPTQIHQIIMNLCTNAGHAMQENGGILEIRLDRIEPDSEFLGRHPELQSGSYVKLTVSDTGTGISTENIERIFEPYFTTKEQGKGTGLGLAMVHGIVKNHGGIITVESRLGKGTTFDVFLPSVAYRREAKEETESELMGGKERILLVDDEHDIIEIEKSILEVLGYLVTATDNAEKALEIFSKKADQFDLVITDLTMPKLPGDKLALELIKIRPDIPIILCTGFSEGVTEENAASLGVKGFLMKPVTVNNLTRAVRKILDEKIKRV